MLEIGRRDSLKRPPDGAQNIAAHIRSGILLRKTKEIK
jgi:hypothetical protein